MQNMKTKKQAARKNRSRVGKIGVTVDSDIHNDLKQIMKEEPKNHSITHFSRSFGVSNQRLLVKVLPKVQMVSTDDSAVLISSTTSFSQHMRHCGSLGILLFLPSEHCMTTLTMSKQQLASIRRWTSNSWRQLNSAIVKSVSSYSLMKCTSERTWCLTRVLLELQCFVNLIPTSLNMRDLFCKT